MFFVRIQLFVTAILLLALSLRADVPAWTDGTRASGLDGHQVSRLKFADLNNDARPDAILLPDDQDEAAPLVFLNQPHGPGTLAFQFQEASSPQLPRLQKGDVLVFADLDNDGNKDAILGRYLDIYQDDYQPPSDSPLQSSWFPGNGDGTFGEAITLANATLGATRSIAINDINKDGLPDLFIGNWYQRYFTGYEAFPNDVLLQYPDSNDKPAFIRWSLPLESQPTDYQTDTRGRPTYGTGIVDLGEKLPLLVELNYGRRWNRLYQLSRPDRLLKPDSSEEDWASRPLDTLREPAALAQHLERNLVGRDIAPEAGIDGDSIRHGRHPSWPSALSKDRPRVTRPDEPPFRANGNTFDLAVGDIDNDGDVDLFVSTIIHKWAGESSDRSRFLVNQREETGELKFFTFERLSVDRLPPEPLPGEPLEPKHTTKQNQGDIYAELADLNNDGRLDLMICSSDYDDAPPFDERLRVFFQQTDGRFKDVTQTLGIDHIGAGMPSLGDVDGDGDLDLLIGQSFNRFNQELRHKAGLENGSIDASSSDDAKPERRARLFINNSPNAAHSLQLKLVGDPERGVSRDAFGSVVQLTSRLEPDASPTIQQRQVHGPLGHAGKQSSFIVHFGLGKLDTAEQIEIRWPNGETTRLGPLKSGRYEIQYGSETAVPLP